VNKRLYRNIGIGVACLAAIWLLISTAESRYEVTPTEIDFSAFLIRIDREQVEEVTIEEGQINGRFTDGEEFTTYAPVISETLIADLHSQGIAIRAQPKTEPSIWEQILLEWFPILLIIGLFIFFMRRMQSGGGMAGRFGKSTARQFESHESTVTFDDVAGIEEAKFELEEIIAFLREPEKFTRLGGRIPKGVLLVGPPGTGKTLLARRLPGLLPPLCENERLEAFSVLDASGIISPDQPISNAPPFRAPHHTASAAGLLGGGNPVRPGEVSLAHHGVLFLDELPEFDRRCLESLREVIEQGVVRIARANYGCELPAHFQLIAAANPCPCGFYGTPGRDCRCDDATLARYRRKLSGPLLDRVDLGVTVGEIPWAVLRAPSQGPTSETVRLRVARARGHQRARGVGTNAASLDAKLDELVKADEAALELLGRAVEILERGEAVGSMEVLYNLACTHVRLGDNAKAEHYLRAAKQHEKLPDRAHIESDADFDAVRDEEWFKALLDELAPAG